MPDTKPVPVPPDFYTTTMQRLRDFRGEYADGTLDRLLTDAEAAIANLIVLEAETAKERDAAQADATRYALNEDREKARAAAEETHLRDVIHAAQRVVRERDEARAALNTRADAAISHRDYWEKTADACAAERNEAYREIHRIRAALGCLQFEPAEDAAKRVVRERDEARHDRDAAEDERDAARTEALFQASKAEGDRHRYDAIFAQSIHLAREVDRLKAAKAAEIEAREAVPTSNRAPLKVGDRVTNTETKERGEVIGFFDSIDGVRFVAVESTWLTRFWFWRLDLVSKVNS